MTFTNDQFALANKISLITGKRKYDWTRDDLLKVIVEMKIERVNFHYTGIDGKLKEMRIPVLNKTQIETVLAEGERCDGSSLFKGIVDAGKSDLYVVPVYHTAFLNPFDDKSMGIICRFLSPDGELAPFAPDNILHKAHNEFKKNTGMEFHALGELEFYLIGNYENNTYQAAKQTGYHGTAPFVKTADVIAEMLKYISQITNDVKYAHNEVGYIPYLESDFEELKGKSAEQVEIEFLPTPIDETADIMVLASWIVRNVAYKHNMIATFFPKIDVDHAGSGLHFHTLLKKDGKNVMVNQDGSLSENSKKLIGGLCQYASSLTAFGNMCSSSYLRLVPHQEAPTKVCWSESNRSAMIRVPLAWTNVSNLAQKLNPQQTEPYELEESRQTVELRSPDGSANVHLLLAGMTMAADWAFSNPAEALRLTEESYVTGNIHSNPLYDNLPELATSCVESSEKLLQHKNLYERNNIFPNRLINYVAQYLEKENDRNLNKRLISLPEEEKKYESRRIMHKHLHKH